jgi:glutathione S-transferase
LQARLWDRVIDGYVMTPMQKIVGDSLRPEGRGDPEGVTEARATLEKAYELLQSTWLAAARDGTSGGLPS